MALIPWQPFRDLERFWDEDFVPFFPALRMRLPAVDVSETENEVTVEMEAPGIDPKEIDLSVKGNQLYIRGSAGEEREDRGKSYYRKEIRRGMFERSVLLPADVKGDEADASYRDGVLKITLPKDEKAKSKKIEVKVS
ncbi:MAG: Hsp20/alpha crystallin family protein [bacterium]|nr:Hsp20/alpha crystallin family protein [bacterium]MDZ4296427.1 Hsp20/alpha crystallin family protein [Patescibacteria group bacterium]